ncbi:MAG: pentapeptide repeat-containing protein [Cyanobacteria bacterium SBLK]|nr:pentapeptide repeat-containing protein [Cyanobacteria bacterium SBLK]
MANEEQLERLKRSVEEWNQWREENLDIKIDLSSAGLRGANLERVNLSRANLRDAKLSRACISHANFSGTDLVFANLSGADLSHTNLWIARALYTNFERTNLTGACIWDWHINNETNLNHVICKYIYLGHDYRGYADRRPSETLQLATTKLTE